LNRLAAARCRRDVDHDVLSREGAGWLPQYREVVPECSMALSFSLRRLPLLRQLLAVRGAVALVDARRARREPQLPSLEQLAVGAPELQVAITRR